MNRKIYDGYKNLAKKIGTKDDVIVELKAYRDSHNNDKYGFLYDSDRLMQTVVDSPVKDAFLTGITSKNNNIVKLFNEYKHVMRDSIIKSRIYGLSVIYKDKVLPNEFIVSLDVEQNPQRDDYLLPTNITLRYISDYDDNDLIFVQQHGTDKYIIDSGGYGYSIVAGIEESIKRYYASLNISTGILGTLNQSIIKMQDLNEKILEGEEDELLDRLDVINYFKSNLSTFLIDKEDDYVNVQKSLSGVKDVIEKNELALCSVARMPYSRLFQRHQSGLANSQESDLKNYYDTVVSEIRENHIRKIFNRILKSNGIDGEWDFLPIYQQNGKEKAETLKMNVDSVEKLIELGIIGGDEVKPILGL